MIKKLISYATEFKKDTILSPVYVALEVVMETIIPLLMAMIIDNGVEKRKYEICIYCWSYNVSSIIFISCIWCTWRKTCS